MDRYELLSGSENELGRGAYGSVYRVRRKSDQRCVARKTIAYNASTANDLQRSTDRAKREWKLIQGLDHQNIIKYLEADWREKHVHIFMEYYEHGSLRSLIEHNKATRSSINQTYLCSIIYQLSVALLYCHFGERVDLGEMAGVTQGDNSMSPASCIIHRDIKPENIFLSSQSQTALDAVKLGDFGVGVLVQGDQMTGTTYTGTPAYRPPEISQRNFHRQKWTPACDIFSLGCTLYELCTSSRPFEEHLEDEADVPEDIDVEFNEDLKKIILQCLSANPQSRPTARDMFKFSAQILETESTLQEAVHNYQLLAAARIGDFVKVSTILESSHSTNPNVQAATDGESLLHKAARLNIYDDALNLLIKRGANVTARSHTGETPLHVAASVGALDCARSLLSMKAPLAAQDRRGWTPFHVAASAGFPDCMALFVKHGIDFRLLTGHEESRSAMHIAAESNQLSVIGWLVQQAQMLHSNPRSFWGKMTWAIDMSGQKIGLHLAGDRMLENRMGKTNETPLHRAVWSGNVEAIQLFLSLGANPLAIANPIFSKRMQQRCTPLHVAAERGHVDAMNALLEDRRSRANLDVRTHTGETALILAAIRGRSCAVSKLVEVGADMNLGAPRNWTALHCAARHGHLDTVQELLHGGASIDARTFPKDETPLMLAAFWGQEAVVGNLLQAGATAKAVDIEGRTILHYAVSGNREDMVELLKDYVDPATRDREGRTALNLAETANKEGCAVVLREI